MPTGQSSNADHMTTRNRVVAGPAPDTTDGGSRAAANDDPDLQALARLATTGLLARTGSASWATREIVLTTALSQVLTITHGNGVAGDPEFDLGDQLPNTVFAGPESGSGTPGFRALVGDDLPLTVNNPASPVTMDTLIRVTIGGNSYDILARAV